MTIARRVRAFFASSAPTTGPGRYAPEADGEPDPGEVVWAWVPYEEDASQGKDRPVLLLDTAGPTEGGAPRPAHHPRPVRHPPRGCRPGPDDLPRRGRGPPWAVPLGFLRARPPFLPAPNPAPQRRPRLCDDARAVAGGVHRRRGAGVQPQHVTDEDVGADGEAAQDHLRCLRQRRGGRRLPER